jgi:uncharacterized protein
MNDQQIPQRLDPFKQIGAGLKYDGFVSLDRLSRLDGLIADQQGKVKVSFRFYRDEQKIAVVSGKVEASLKLVCQRCHDIDEFLAESEFCFALLRKEEDAQYLPEMYEPLVLQAPELDIFELIEEELILTLPIVHYHDESYGGACAEAAKNTTFGATDVDSEVKPNPFAVLEKLKN